MFARQQAVTKRINIEFEVNEHDSRRWNTIPNQINQVLLNLI